MKGSITLIISFALFITGHGQISSFFSKEDIPSLDNILSTASDVYHYLNILSGFKLDTTKICQKECNSLIKNNLISVGKENIDFYNLYYAVASSKICKCSGLEVPASIKSQIAETSIITLDSIKAVSGIVLAADILDIATPALLDQSASRLKKFTSSDGTFKEFISSPSGNSHGLTIALDAIVVIHKAGSHKDFVSDVYEKGFQLVPNGDGEYAADPLLIVPLSKLTVINCRKIVFNMYNKAT